MSSDVVSNPPQATESKSSRKKKAKAEHVANAAPASTSSVSATEAQAVLDESKTNGADNSENSYVRELQKNVRNINKKINATQKVDSILAEHPDSTLDELLASKKINADQKAQALKKPQLQAQLAQYEEQLTQFKKVDGEYQQKLLAEKELLQTSHNLDLQKLRDTLKAESAAEEKKNLKQHFLTLSKFLHTAAAKRQLDEPDSDERQAFEGVLLLVYGGDANAVDAIEKLVEGSDDTISSIEGTLTGVKFSQIREASLAGGPAEELIPDAAAQGDDAIVSDPTVAHAGLTELEHASGLVNGTNTNDEISGIPPAASINAEAANAAAEEQWDQTGKEDALAESFEIVPRDPAETETSGIPAATTSTQSWADETIAESAAAPTAPAAGNDGFHEVHHQRGGRGRGDGRGSFRGRGRGDRGRGFRGRGGPGRGRGGHGGPRGDSGPPAS